LREFLGNFFLIGLQSDTHDVDPDAEAGHNRATRHCLALP
jgi:hypothetical protein